jgi:transmembrane sensor
MNSNDAEIAASEWLARLDRDELSPPDLAAFERWKTADPRHAAAYARLAATWQALDRVQAIRPSPGALVDNDYLYDAGQHRPRTQQSAAECTVGEDSPREPSPQPLNVPSQRPFSARPSIFIAVAASLLLTFAGVWVAHIAGSPQAYRTGIGGFLRIVLADQTAIKLNTDSEVRVALLPQLRKVELVRGEASFEVAHDASRPFIVSAGNTAVRAVGTKFDVYRLASSVEITVDEGKVIVGAPELLDVPDITISPTLLPLAAGQSALASGSGVQLKELPKREMARKLAWQNQMLVFDSDTLAEVVAQFNRYNTRQLVIADPRLATLQIGGYFRATNLDAFIRVLQSDFGIRVNPDGNQLVLAAATAN